MCKALEIVKEHKLHSSDSHDDGQEQGWCVCVWGGGSIGRSKENIQKPEMKRYSLGKLECWELGMKKNTLNNFHFH